ncbi:DUF2953 domain-containing protein [Alicyclobacillus dauci]|uniref:DUF2953 domain-containing protein n=1 Tax=Alicyclobacillus dauci TaxID=1475485 RepID=A0ABY6Z8L3_9BACL|nr:DUF2953 domain-containing protein [Alicyclobacillus dauci]WAH39070.1 DUF2953 domain-containing protein [Alicyclobacillus dauci]
MIALFLVCAVLICITILLFLPVEIRVHYEHVKEDDNGFLELRYLHGLIRLRRELTKVQAGMTNEGPTIHVHGEKSAHNHSKEVISASGILNHWKSIRERFRTSLPILRRTARHLRIHELEFEAAVGMHDAVATGMTVGAMYAVTTGLFGAVSHACRLQTSPKVHIQPVFNQPLLSVKTHSIMRIPLGYAISAGIRLLLAWKRRT